MISKTINETLVIQDLEGNQTEHIAVLLTKETVRFEVLLVTRMTRVARKWSWLDADGIEILAKIQNLEFDFATMAVAPGFTQTYAFLRNQFDALDPV